MLGSNAGSKELSRVAEFYHGKSIFITGAGGFVGSVLLETLLRCCPGIKSIYILLRPRKNIQPEDRKEQILFKKIFEKLKEGSQELLRKVQVIPGDVSLPNLGMNDGDTQMLLEEVSIVFHCASDISHTKPLEFLLENNVLSLSSIIELCRKMRKFEVLVYTSTAYSNCNRLNLTLKEEVYRLPLPAGLFLDALKNKDMEKFQELITHCELDWPNSYTFTKCLAENVIMDTASDLPVAIIRPSIVINTWKKPLPGYLEDNNGLIAVTLGAGKGFLKVVHADPKCKLNFVPADSVANAHVLAAWSIGTKRYVPPLVVNCTATENLHVNYSEYFKTMDKLFKEFPLPQSFDLPTNTIIVPYKYVYYIIVAYYHYFPAVVFDGMSKILQKKSRIYSLYRFFDRVTSIMNYYTIHSFEFERTNLEYLDSLIHPEDRKDLTLDFKDATLLGMALSLPEGSPFYDWKIDKKSQWERQRIKHKRHVEIHLIHGMFLMTSCLIIYWVLYFIFN